MTSYSIGIDFGGTKLVAAAVDSAGSVLYSTKLPTPKQSDQLINELVDSVIDVESNMGSKSTGIGIGAAGLVDVNGLYRYGPNVGGLSNLDLGFELRARLGDRNIKVDNDNTCSTVAENKLGAGLSYKDFVFVGIGTGIGGGLVMNGSVYKGSNMMAGEMGHMTVASNGVGCVCGRMDCWEAYASGSALSGYGKQFASSNGRMSEMAGGIDFIKGEHVTAAAQEGDNEALQALDRFAYWFGLGAANLVALLDPACVVIGGGMSPDACLFVEKVERHLAEQSFARFNRPPVPLVPTQLGPLAGAIGAAMLFDSQ